MISIVVDTAKINYLKDKLDRFPVYAIGGGLEKTADYLNTPSFKNSMYAPSQSGQPFVWSSEKQRRFVFANIKLPSSRTMNLANSGKFVVNKTFGISAIYYENSAPYSKWVIGNFTQIIGHITRKWKPANYHVVNQKGNVLNIFRDFVSRAWSMFR